ncbi:hypothetical protein SAMN05421761_102350 [Belliella pelovolcani]|uniref:Uncharacterized protein n=1 Tax=Belliella pelovolcani TaxID=529505 RepID=A0A1N7KU77_9BACT|nr:hypothetical protein SAMN05421761_102350 [Belliella pelovolcani]
MALSDWNTINIYRNMVEIELKYSGNMGHTEYLAGSLRAK